MKKPFAVLIALLTVHCSLLTVSAQRVDTLEQVSVVADRARVVYRIDRRVIDAAGNLMGAGGTAIDVLENTPSVRVDADGEVTFRGSAGFRVYVDGKPGTFAGTAALQQIPASRIENIEIVTTPSARFDTEGEVGMINIVTRRSSRPGVNGAVNTSVGYEGSNAVDFQLTRQGRKLEWHLSGHWRTPLLESDFHQAKQTLGTSSISDGPRSSRRYHKGLAAGLTWHLSPRWDVNAEGAVVNNKTSRRGDLAYQELSGGTTSEYISRDRFTLQATVITAQAGFEHRFRGKEGHRLSGSLMLAPEPDGYEVFQSRLFDPSGAALKQGHVAIEDEFRWTVRANLDYVYPFSATGRLEAGWQFHSYLEDGRYGMYRFDPSTDDFEWDEGMYNLFRFQQGVHSVYVMAGETFGKVTVQAGLRGEHTHRILRSTPADRTTDRFEVFPSAHVGYKNFTLAYSYRTNRPNIWWMEPYVTYSDFYTAQIGNPDIRPEYIHSAELTCKKYVGRHVIQSGAFARVRRDKIERLRVPYVAGVTLDSMANAASDVALGLELSAQLRPARRWNIDAMGNVYHYRVKNNATGGRQTSLNYDLTLSNTVRVGRTTRLQADGNFVGPTVTTQGRSDAFWFVNLAVRQQLWAPNLQATLSMRNAFDSARYRSTVTAADLSSVTRIRPRWPVVSLAVSYAFNNFRRNEGAAADNRELFEGSSF